MIGILYTTLSCRPVAALVFPKRDSVPAPALLARLSGIYDDTASAAVLGKAYLERYPEEANAKRLVALICPDPWLEDWFLRADRAGLRRLLGFRVRMDFAGGKTVRLGGWALSRTEARLYDLAAITKAKQSE
jgi:hypothetical protein